MRTTNADGKREKFRVNSGRFGEAVPWSYEILKEDKPFATLSVKWTSEKRQENQELIEGAWIFEKLTGMAREDFPERHAPEKEDKPKLARLEDFATVDVKIADGNEEARRLFHETK